HRLRIVAGEIAADRIPRLAAVGRLPHALRRGVEDVRIDRGEDDRISPLPALDDRGRVLAREEARIGSDLALLTGAAIESREERSVVRAGEEDVHVFRVGRDVARLAAADRVERLDAAASSAAASEAVVARDAERAVVLLRA